MKFILFLTILYSSLSFAQLTSEMILENHLKIFYQDSFNFLGKWNPDWGKNELRRPKEWNASDFEVTHPSNCQTHEKERVLDLFIPQDKHHNQARDVSPILESQEVWVSFKIMFGNFNLDKIDNEDEHWNKLPGFLGGGSQTSGGKDNDGTHGWSSRMSWSKDKSTGKIKLGYYAYHPNKPIKNNGDWSLQWDQVSIEPCTWYEVIQRIRVNDIYKNLSSEDECNNSDCLPNGILEAYIDGKKVFARDHMVFTKNLNFQLVKSYWINSYYGGTKTAPEDLHIYFDDLYIYTQPLITFQSFPYPNPTTDFLHMNYQVNQSGLLSTKIINLIGQESFHQERSLEPGEYTQELDVQSLTPGFYILNFSFKGLNYSYNFIKSS